VSDQADLEATHLLNATTAVLEMRAIDHVLKNTAVQRLLEGNIDRLARGERVENRIHNGNGPLANMDILLLDYDK